MEIEQYLSKPFVAFDVLHDVLVYGRLLKPLSEFQQRSLSNAQARGYREWQKSRDSFNADYVKPFLMDAASTGQTMNLDDGHFVEKRTRPAPFIQWLLLNGFTPCESAASTVQTVLTKHLRDTPPSLENGGQEDEQTPTPAEKNFHTPPPEKKLFTPDNRVLSTKDTPKAGPMRQLITELFIQFGDNHEPIWRELVRLASSDEGRGQNDFLMGVESKVEKTKNKQWVLYVEFGESKKMNKVLFNRVMDKVRKSVPS